MAVSRKFASGVALLAASALLLSACGSGRTDDSKTKSTGGGGSSSQAGSSLTVGTTDVIYALDPAGAYDNGSYNVWIQVYPFLLGFPPNDPTPQPSAAKKCEFDAKDGTIYRCTMKSGLKFANGNDLTASDVKFTFDRMLKINDPNGPSSLLGNLASVEVEGKDVVNFKLKSENDQTFPQVLASPAGPIVDEEVFPADKLLADADIVKEKAFAGPYAIKSYNPKQTVEYEPFEGYDGAQGTVKNGGVTVNYYTDETNMKLDIENGAIDVATRSLSATDIESLKSNKDVKVVNGPGGEERYLVFNLDIMPGDSPEQKLAVRQAVASSVDREELSKVIYKGTFTPMYGFVPEGLPGGESQPLKKIYGEKPDKSKAAKYLSDAGVKAPVELNLQYNPDHYGTSSADEYNAIKSQLEGTGLFKVNLQSAEWSTYNKERVQNVYPVYQLGWFPDFPDPDNYLTVFFDKDNFLENNYTPNDQVKGLLDSQRTDGDKKNREKTLDELQEVLAKDFLPSLPLLQGSQVAVARSGVEGVVLDASFQFRYLTLSK